MTTANGRVMVVTAHPDDPEFLAGGTVARLVKEGREVTYVIVTNGNKGSGDRAITSERLAPIREEEQRRAARVFGVEHVEFLGYEDGEVEDTRNLRRDVTRQIRRWQPSLIVTQNPNRTYSNFPGWHRDHRITGGVVLDCVYPLARDHLSFPELLPAYEPHQVREVYLIQWEQPSLVVDIADTMDIKLKAISCHASQLGDFSVVEARMRARAAALGRQRAIPTLRVSTTSSFRADPPECGGDAVSSFSNGRGLNVALRSPCLPAQIVRDSGRFPTKGGLPRRAQR